MQTHRANQSSIAGPCSIATADLMGADQSLTEIFIRLPADEIAPTYCAPQSGRVSFAIGPCRVERTCVESSHTYSEFAAAGFR